MDQQLKRFEEKLNQLICVACDWRLAWDGSGLDPEVKLTRAKNAVLKLYKQDCKKRGDHG